MAQQPRRPESSPLLSVIGQQLCFAPSNPFGEQLVYRISTALLIITGLYCVSIACPSQDMKPSSPTYVSEVLPLNPLTLAN